MQKHQQSKEQEYKQDFDDSDDKNSPIAVDFQAQVTPQPSHKVNTQQNYEQDFVQPSIDTHNNESIPSKHHFQNTPNRQKMIEQNQKLKTQIFELAKQMDEINQREKKTKKYGIHAQEGDDDQIMKNKKNQLKKQQLEIMSLKSKILQTKKQLELVYDSRGVQNKEDELKNIQKQLKILQDEKDALVRVKREQTKALKLIRNDAEYENKLKQLKQELSSTRQECKHLSDKILQNDRVLRKNHQVYIMKQTKIKQMQAKIKQNKQRAKRAGSSALTVTNQMIDQLEKQLIALDTMRKQAERVWYDKIGAIEAEINQKRMEQEKKQLILKEKQKQLKLNEIRIKQLKKLIQHHTSQQNTKKQQQKQSDMKEYRHRRNIKHLQK